MRLSLAGRGARYDGETELSNKNNLKYNKYKQRVYLNTLI